MWWSAIAGAVGGMMGSIGKNQAADDQAVMINNQKVENESWYRRRYNEDPTQRASAQAMLARTEKYLRERNHAAEGRRAVIGGTNESIAAEKEASADTMGNMSAQIAAAGDARQDRIEQQYLNRKYALEDKEMENEAKRANGFDIASSVLGGFGNGMSLGNLGGGK